MWLFSAGCAVQRPAPTILWRFKWQSASVSTALAHRPHGGPRVQEGLGQERGHRRGQRPHGSRDAGVPLPVRLGARPFTPARSRSATAVSDVDGTFLKVTAEKDPAKLPWRAMGVDRSSSSAPASSATLRGRRHLTAGAKKVIISAPAKAPCPRSVLGINEDKYDRPSTTSLERLLHHQLPRPGGQVLHENFGLVNGLMTTIHSYTNDQVILDFPHKDLHRARAAGMSMIRRPPRCPRGRPGDAGARGQARRKAVRVPTPNVSLVDLTALVEKPVTAAAVNEAYKKAAAAGPLAGLLGTTTTCPTSRSISTATPLLHRRHRRDHGEGPDGQGAGLVRQRGRLRHAPLRPRQVHRQKGGFASGGAA